jgi:iron complex transport system ATP-binding protein
MNMNPKLLGVEKLCCRLGGRDILRDVSFSLVRGGCLSVIGANGAGKSTLIRCLAGLVESWTGHINLSERALQDYAPHERARVVSYVPQSIHHVIPFSVFEFMLQSRYPFYRHSVPSPADHKAAREALDVVGMAGFAQRRMSTLSGGECQLVLIAAALCSAPSVMLLDEPVTHLDYRHALKVQQILRRLNEEQGIALVSVLHDVNQAVALGGEVLALKDGCVAFCGAAKGLLDQPKRLYDVYGVHFEMLRMPGERGDLVLPVD